MDKRRYIFSQKLLLLLVVLLFASHNGRAQFNINAASTNYTENFNSLTSGTWTDNTTLTGWYSKTDATASIVAYAANTGSTTTAGLYAFGVAGTNALTDRALGFAPSNAYTGTAGTQKGYMGWRLYNNTGSSISSITVTWTGEQWRKENTTGQTLVLSYQQSATVSNLTAGAWTATTSIFTSPQINTAAAALDGNAAANRSANISVTITVNIPAGQEIMLRWEDLNDTGNDHLLAIDDITINATAGTSPALSVSSSTLTGFTYIFGNGPSTSQSYNLSGTNLTGAPGNITVTGTTDYEVSSDNITFGATANIAYGSATLASTPVYVRLKTGLAAGNYNLETVSNAGGGATTQNVTCSGNVTTPTITLSPSSLTGFTYIVTNGPSTNQTFTCSGSSLSANITLSAPTDYEISLSAGAGFGASLTLSPTSASVAATTIYVRLKAGLAIGTYNAETITASSTGATLQTVTCNGTVTASAASDVIAVASSEAAAVSSIVNISGPLTSVQGIQVWQFTIRDGGASADADNLPTIVNAITIANLNSAGLDWSTAINSIDLFDGVTNVGSLQFGSANLTSSQAQFTGLTVSVPDNSSKTITVRLTVHCPLGAGNIEGDYFRFSISNGNFTVAASGSSQKSGFAAAQSTATTTFNDLDIVATQLQFVQQPTTTGVNTSMSPSVTVKATDVCGNTDLGFAGTISITSTGTLTGAPVTATAISGVATFAGLTHTVAGTNYTLTAASTGLTSIISSLFDITTVTNFGAGDIAIVGMCVDINGCGGSTSAGEDEISFVSFEDITPGTTIDLTDNGFERVGCNNNSWGNTEGVIRITRTTSTLPKGTIVTLRILDQSIFSAIQPDGNWTVTYPNSGFGTFNLNSNDEQVYIMQGGTWNKGTSSGAHDATYTGGTLMFAINTYTAWTCNGASTQRGNLPLALKCFSILPGIAAKNLKYTGPVTSASQKDWVDRLNNTTNWTGTNTCAAYVSAGLDYGGTTQTYTILSSGFNSGYWTGATNTDWYDCNNWQNYKVPDSLANVTIDNVTNDPVIGASPALYPNGAVCNDLFVTSTFGAGVLTLNNSLSYLSIKGNIVNNGTITASNGLTDLRSVNAQTFSGSGTTTFYNLRLNNTNASGVSLLQDVTVTNTLTFINGMLNTGTNKFIITNTVVPTISGYTSTKFINGHLRHYIGSNTSAYVFPIGDGTASSNYKRVDLVNNNLTGVTYIDAFVNTITETTPNDDATFAGAGQSQNGSALGYIMENAEWDLTPDAAPTGNNYGVRLYTANTGLSASEDDQFFAVKRPSSSTTYSDWVSLDASTTITNAGTAGRVYNSGAGYAERLGYTSFSKHAISKFLTPLPIELLSFNAKYNGNTTDLYWTTATETNNDYFTIEKSADAVEFKPVGTVKGAGNSAVILNYSAIDKEAIKGISYYRLKQTDFNGKTSYSQIVAVNIRSSFSELIYPNPATDILHVRLSVDIKSSCVFQIVSIQGVVLSMPSVQYSERGVFSIDLRSISAGTYILRTTVDNETKQTLFIKQ